VTIQNKIPLKENNINKFGFHSEIANRKSGYYFSIKNLFIGIFLLPIAVLTSLNWIG